MPCLKHTLSIGGTAVWAVLLAATASQAASFGYTFTGEVTGVENPNGFFTNAAVVGAAVSGSFTYTDTPNQPPFAFNPGFTNYTHQGTPADTELALNIGGTALHSSTSSLTNMIVGDNNPTDNFPPFFPIGDSFRYGDALDDSSSLFDFSQAFFSQYANGSLFLVDSTAGVFGSQALPSGLLLSSFDLRYGIVDLYDDNFDGTGRLTFRIDSIQAVPEPGTCILLLTGLAAVAAGLQTRRRRHRPLPAPLDRSDRGGWPSPDGQLRCLRALSLAMAILALASAERTAWAAPGDIYNLGTLGTLDGAYSAGSAINNAGQVAGIAYPPDAAAAHAFRYSGTPGSGGAMLDLGTLGGMISGGNAINDAGQVAGRFTTVDNFFHAFRYTGTPGSGGAMLDLGTLGGTISSGNAINNAGQVAGYAYTTGNTTTHAFRYTGTPGSGGAMVDLGTLGGTTSSGYAINNAGQVAGDAYTTAGSTTTHAFRYTGTPGSGGAMVDLGTLGGTNSFGNAINGAGQVVGNADTTGNAATHAFRYTGTPGSGGAMVDLGTLGGTNSFGNAINNAGFVVGRAERSADGSVSATLWQTDAGNTAVDLDAWLDATNPLLGAYWTLNYASGINNNGLITGFGTYDDGPGGLDDGLRAYILDASNLVPEPSSLTLAALAAAALAIRCNRRIKKLPSLRCVQ